MTSRRRFISDASRSVAGLGLAAAIPSDLLFATGAADRPTRAATGTGLYYDPRCLDHVVPASRSGAPRA